MIFKINEIILYDARPEASETVVAGNSSVRQTAFRLRGERHPERGSRVGQDLRIESVGS
jgi:hypothetical protein